MSDLENLKAIKDLLEGRELDETINSELLVKRFFTDAAKLCFGESGNSETGIKVYHPEKMLEFLRMPGDRLQLIMGGSWKDMDPIAFDALSYTVSQKIQKSTSLIDWNS